MVTDFGEGAPSDSRRSLWIPRRYRKAMLLSLLLAGISLAGWATYMEQRVEVVVLFKTNSSAQEVQANLRILEDSNGFQLKQKYQLVPGFFGTMPRYQIGAVKEYPWVRSISENFKVGIPTPIIGP